MYVYIYILHILEKKFELSIHVHACMHVCMDVCKEKITNKQSFECNMYTTWDASLQGLCGRIPWGT